MEITGKLEDYLESIFVLRGKKELPVRVKDIAPYLDVSKATVVSAIKKLKDAGLVIQEHYGYIYLTEDGLVIAKNIYNRHSVLKDFLENTLKINPDTADEEACKIEHHLSDNTIKQLTLLVTKLKESDIDL